MKKIEYPLKKTRVAAETFLLAHPVYFLCFYPKPSVKNKRDVSFRNVFSKGNFILFDLHSTNACRSFPDLGIHQILKD